MTTEKENHSSIKFSVYRPRQRAPLYGAETTGWPELLFVLMLFGDGHVRLSCLSKDEMCQRRVLAIGPVREAAMNKAIASTLERFLEGELTPASLRATKRELARVIAQQLPEFDKGLKIQVHDGPYEEEENAEVCTAN